MRVVVVVVVEGKISDTLCSNLRFSPWALALDQAEQKWFPDVQTLLLTPIKAFFIFGHSFNFDGHFGCQNEAWAKYETCLKEASRHQETIF
jgi:hypothetical protein